MGYLEQNEQFLKKAYQKAVIPCMLSVLSGSLNILADGILVGQRLGADALAAISFSLPVYLVLCIAGSFLVSGTAICASAAIGSGNQEQAQKLYQMAIAWCVLVSLAITAAGLVCIKPLSSFLCGGAASAEVADGTSAAALEGGYAGGASVMALTAEYAGITLAGALPKILIYIPFWFLRLDGRNRWVTVMMAVMGAGNVVLDLIFLYVLDLGVFGAGLASVIATAAAAALGFVLLCDKKSSFRFGFLLGDGEISWRRIAQAGSPSAMNNLFQTLRVTVINSLLLQSGGSTLVAAFTAVNCISAFSESVTGGVPQAASAMLGICSGEHDNGSVRILVRRELRSGAAYCALFSGVILAGADLIAWLYALPVSLGFAMLSLSLSLFPGLLNSVLSGYYNVSGRILWSNGMILLRTFLMPCMSLWLLTRHGQNPWWFLVLGELLTSVVWLAAAELYHRRTAGYSRFLLMDCALEESGNVINFSVADSDEAICDASSRITQFCEKNGMLPKQTMRISLALEEILTVIAQENREGAVEFDLRVFALQGEIGIRIRYSGTAFDPFRASDGEQEDRFMGIRMIDSLVKETQYLRTFGTNTLRILI